VSTRSVLAEKGYRDPVASTMKSAEISAPDAVTIDTTLLDADQAFEQASHLVARLCAPAGANRR